MKNKSSEPQDISSLNPRDIELQILSSSQDLELGEPWKILLHITNHSPHAIWISNLSTTLMPPAEIVHPAESKITSRAAQMATVIGPGFETVCIQPAGKYICTWRLNEDKNVQKENCTFWDVFLWHIFFHPGQYDVQAHIHIWIHEPDIEILVAPNILEQEEYLNIQKMFNTLKEKRLHKDISTPSNAENKKEEQNDNDKSLNRKNSMDRSYTNRWNKLLEAKQKQAEVLSESLSLTTTGGIEITSRSLTLLGASAIGGFLAFLFRELYWLAQKPSILSFSDLALLLSYILTAIVINLFVSRLTESRLLHTIKIADFWSTIAFGVLTAFIGNAFLKKLLIYLK